MYNLEFFIWYDLWLGFYLLFETISINNKQNFNQLAIYLSFSTSTTLEISSGALPDLLNSFFPASLCRASNRILLGIKSSTGLWNEKSFGQKFNMVKTWPPYLLLEKCCKIQLSFGTSRRNDGSIWYTIKSLSNIQESSCTNSLKPNTHCLIHWKKTFHDETSIHLDCLPDKTRKERGGTPTFGYHCHGQISLLRCINCIHLSIKWAKYYLIA